MKTVVVENQDVNLTRPVVEGYELSLKASLGGVEAQFLTPKSGEVKATLRLGDLTREDTIRASLSLGEREITVIQVPNPLLKEEEEEWVKEAVYSVGDGFHKVRVFVSSNKWHERLEEKAQITLGFDFFTDEIELGNVSASYLFRKVG